MIQKGEEGWESMVPPEVVQMVKNNCLFGYPCDVFPPSDMPQAIEHPTVIEVPQMDLGIGMGYFGGDKTS